jgi:hypothetical protein
MKAVRDFLTISLIAAFAIFVILLSPILGKIFHNRINER